MKTCQLVEKCGPILDSWGTPEHEAYILDCDFFVVDKLAINYDIVKVDCSPRRIFINQVVGQNVFIAISPWTCLFWRAYYCNHRVVIDFAINSIW